MRFQILGPEGQTFELSDLDYFRKEYEPKGYTINADPPAGHDVPDPRPPKKAEKAVPPKAEKPEPAKAEDGEEA